MDEEVSEYKPITGKVRCMVDCYAWRDNRDFQDFIDALDAIDSVHSQLERENEDLRMKYVNANRHALHMEHENESLKAELDRVLGEQDNGAIMPLPKDMNDEPIHIGDVMEWYDGETFEVVGIGDGVLFYVKDGHEQADWTGASTKRHHQPDTWERILHDAMAYAELPTDMDMQLLVARCKALCERTKEDA